MSNACLLFQTWAKPSRIPAGNRSSATLESLHAGLPHEGGRADIHPDIGVKTVMNAKVALSALLLALSLSACGGQESDPVEAAQEAAADAGEAAADAAASAGDAAVAAGQAVGEAASDAAAATGEAAAAAGEAAKEAVTPAQ